MNGAVVGWLLAAAVVAVGGWQYGWQGVVMAASIIVFWMLLQFNRSVRAMKLASGRPVGLIENAVMLQAKVRPGMSLIQVLPLTRSLGERLPLAADDPPDSERYAWRDQSGDAVVVMLVSGKVTDVVLQRAAAAGDSASTPA